MRREFRMPDAGEGLTEAEIVAWQVAVGDEVAVNQVIVEIETAKAVVELPSPYAGTVGALLAEPGQIVAVGAPIIAIETAEVGGATAGVSPAPADDGAGTEGTGGDGAKIGEAGVDGRIATLVGYGPRPGSVQRRQRTRPASTAAAPAPSVPSPAAASSTAAPAPAAPAAATRATSSATAAPAPAPAPAPAAPAPAAPAPVPPAAASTTVGDQRFGTPDRTEPGPAFPTVDHPGAVAAPFPHDQHPGTLSRSEPGPGFPTADREGSGNGHGVAGGTRATGGGAAGLVPLAKPPVRKIARDLGVDLHSVSGSGAGGVITREDVESHATATASAAAAGTAPSTIEPDISAPGARTPHVDGDRREPIRGVRRATAAAMVASAFTAPHVTEFLTVDVTATMALRERLRGTRDFADVAVTPLAFVAKAVCLAARRTPVINASWDEATSEIVYRARVQLGIAAATPRGLIVPKIRDADTLGLRDMARALGELTTTARSGRTPPADLVGGTFTITNVGVFGVDTGTPIINPGEAAILAVGSIKPAPWVVDGELAVRTVCQLALSFDHRLVDGEQGSRYLADVGAVLADPGLALTW